jgi:hypothetical protein
MESEHMMASLMEPFVTPGTLLACKKETKTNKLDDIKDIIEVGQQLMSFGQFISNKTLGSHLSLTNKTDKEQTIEVAVDGKNESYAETT